MVFIGICFFLMGCGSEDSIADNGDATNTDADVSEQTDVEDSIESDAVVLPEDVDDGDAVLPPIVCKEGTPCDDGEPCTYGDVCGVDGTCVGMDYACDDDRVCTENECDGLGGCLYPIVEGSCLIGNVCYEDGMGILLRPYTADHLSLLLHRSFIDITGHAPSLGGTFHSLESIEFAEFAMFIESTRHASSLGGIYM